MGVPPKSQETTMLSWSLLTVPHGDTSLMLAVTTATAIAFAQLGIALAQQGIIAYWLWRWIRKATHITKPSWLKRRSPTDASRKPGGLTTVPRHVVPPSGVATNSEYHTSGPLTTLGSDSNEVDHPASQERRSL
jgi:hypothetical protein